jgi:hypothetical protein
MSRFFSGGCACGAVRYECHTKPRIAWQCHCRDCQRASGSAFAPLLYVASAALTSTGELKYYAVQGEGNRTVSRGFCPECGSPVLVKTARPEFTGVWVGSLDDPSWVQPTIDMWAGSAQPWDTLVPHRRQYERQPLPEEVEALLAAQSEEQAG